MPARERFACELELNHERTTEIARAELLAWIEEFEAAAKRALAERLKYAFVRTYEPVLDDAPYRSFDTMADYRKWCEENLPSWLDYCRADLSAQIDDLMANADTIDEVSKE